MNTRKVRQNEEFFDTSNVSSRYARSGVAYSRMRCLGEVDDSRYVFTIGRRCFHDRKTVCISNVFLHKHLFIGEDLFLMSRY